MADATPDDKATADYGEGFREGMRSVGADHRRSRTIVALTAAHRRMSNLGERDAGVISTLSALERAIRRVANAMERTTGAGE